MPKSVLKGSFGLCWFYTEHQFALILKILKMVVHKNKVKHQRHQSCWQRVKKKKKSTDQKDCER